VSDLLVYIVYFSFSTVAAYMANEVVHVLYNEWCAHSFFARCVVTVDDAAAEARGIVGNEQWTAATDAAAAASAVQQLSHYAYQLFINYFSTVFPLWKIKITFEIL